MRAGDPGQNSAPSLPPWGYIKSLELSWEFSVLTIPRSGTGIFYFRQCFLSFSCPGKGKSSTLPPHMGPSLHLSQSSMCPLHQSDPQGRRWEYHGGCVQPKKLKQSINLVSCSASMSEQYLHPCSSSRSSWVHCLDVARSSSSDHKPPAHCIPHNLQGKQKGSLKSRGMGWREEMQQFPERQRAHDP